MNPWELLVYVLVGWGIKALADGAVDVWGWVADRRTPED